MLRLSVLDAFKPLLAPILCALLIFAIQFSIPSHCIRAHWQNQQFVFELLLAQNHVIQSLSEIGWMTVSYHHQFFDEFINWENS